MLIPQRKLPLLSNSGHARIYLGFNNSSKFHNLRWSSLKIAADDSLADLLAEVVSFNKFYVA